MSIKLKETDTRPKVNEAPGSLRSGGEQRPLEYPHLYQIQAGGWRISYAVEHNHLAILVLEVLNADGTVKEDPAHDKLTRKMKVKLLDWPEGSPSRDLPPEDLGKKVKIKLLDLADDLHDEVDADTRSGSKLRLRSRDSGTAPRRQITLLGNVSPGPSTSVVSEDETQGRAVTGGKVTPLDSPSM
jgi:mRNA-degrading endonuclease RelE of RelBE toxin-antitoxin system